jgi:hypothetical protein
MPTMTPKPYGLRPAAVAALAGALLLAAPGAASAESPAGPSAGSPATGTYTAVVTVSGNGVGRGGDLGVPPVTRGGGRVTVPSPCGYEKGIRQEELQKLQDKYYPNGNAREVMTGEANKLDNFDHPTDAAIMRAQAGAWDREGTWYISRCDFDAEGIGIEEYREFFFDNPPVLVPDGAAPPQADAPADPEFLLQVAQGAMTLPTPTAQVVRPETVVRLDTWVWVAPDAVGTRTVTASVPTMQVTVTATSTGSLFSSAGAPTVACAGAGHPADASCALTYQRSSGAAPGQQFGIVASTVWEAAASGALTRALPGATMAGPPVGITVREVQTVSGD